MTMITTRDFESLNIYRIYTEADGTRMIKILGFFYDSEDETETPWRDVEFCGFEMPLGEYIANEDMWGIWESEAKQYIGDLTEEEAIEAFLSYGATSAALSLELPDGIYY